MSSALTIKEKKDNFKLILNKKKDELSGVLPKHLQADIVINTIMVSLSKTPALLECTQASLYGSILQASRLGLMPDSILGQAYLIPYKVKGVMTCQFIPGYKGLVDLAYRSGKVKEIYAEPVYERDEFLVIKGLNRNIVHNPSPDCDPRKDKITHFYAVIKYKDGGFDFEAMTKSEVDFIRAKSNGATNKVWDDYYSEMGKKTVLRRLMKMAPLTTEMATAISLDEQAELGKNQKNSSLVHDDIDFAEDIDIETEAEFAESDDAKVQASRDNIQDRSSKAVQATIDGMVK